MNYRSITKKLECDDIPDTRKLQEIRLNSIGKISSSEEFMKKHYPDKYNIPRIVMMPEEEIRQVYSLAIPLNFPMLDPISYGNGCKTDFFRWGSSDGAMHLTTDRNMNELIKLFSKNNIHIKINNAFGSVLDMGRTATPGITVPHSWRVEHYDPYQGFFEHQFVVFDKPINACPYFYTKKEISHTQEEDKYEKVSITLTNKIEKSVELKCHATFYISEYFKPEDFLPELLKKYENNLKINHSSWRESQKEDKETFHSIELKLLSIGEPVEIYNPKWIE